MQEARQILLCAQVPFVEYRAEPYRPASAVLFTGDDPATARDIAANMFPTANLSDTAVVANATELFRAGLAEVRLLQLACATQAMCMCCQMQISLASAGH